MRCKTGSSFFKTFLYQAHKRHQSNAIDHYTKMVNQATSSMWDMHALIARLGKERKPLNALENQLDQLITYHSLAMTDEFSLTFEDAEYLSKESKTLFGKDSNEQQRVLNYRKILDYCRQYQKALEASGWGQRYLNNNTPNDDILAGINNLATNFVLIFSQGLGGGYEIMYGNYYPAGTFYFFDREEYTYINNGQKLLIQTLRESPDDPILNAARIHNEFAKGHQFDTKFGLLFCRLYMNFALMLTGHAPAIITSSQKEEYFQLVQQDKLTDPQPLAEFLVKSLNNTYQNHIIPVLKDGVPYYIDLKCKEHYLNMIEQEKLARKCIKESDPEQAKTHIKSAIKHSRFLSGITPAISSIKMDLYEQEKEIEEQSSVFKNQ